MSLPGSVVRVAFAAYFAAAATLYVLQDRLLLPSAPRTAGLPTRRRALDDIEPWHPGGYAGYVVTPAGRSPAGTFLVYHGNAESAEDKLPLASVFVRAGYRAVLVEYPGYGTRPGARTMKAALAASRSALSDARQAWPGPLFLAGESLGAGMAAQVIAGSEPAVAGALLITPWDSLASIASEKLRLFPVRWMLHDPFDSVDALERYTGPLVVIGAERDALIPVRHAERLARLHPGAQLVLLPGAEHDSWFGAMTDALWQQTLRALRADGRLPP